MALESSRKEEFINGLFDYMHALNDETKAGNNIGNIFATIIPWHHFHI